MRPSGPLPLTVARLTPSSAARRFARGEALTSVLPASAPLPSCVAGAGCAAGWGDGGADLGRHALLNDDVEHSVGFGLEVERRLVRFHLGDHLALLDGVAALLLPLDDRALLHRVGELGHVYISHRAAS